jgi:hypothetical protein
VTEFCKSKSIAMAFGVDLMGDKNDELSMSLGCCSQVSSPGRHIRRQRPIDLTTYESEGRSIGRIRMGLQVFTATT